MRIYELRRNAAINKIVASLRKAKEKKREIEIKDLLLMVMADNNVSKRTAKEYIEVARVLK